MANPEHLAILKQGVDVWTKWRIDNPKIKPDLSYLDFEDKIFSGVDFSNVALSESKFINSNLVEVNFEGAILNYSNFQGSDLSESRFNESDLCGSNLSRTNLREVNFQGANLKKVDFHKTDLSGIDFIKNDLSGANLNEADLSNANLTDANLTEANLRVAILCGAILYRTIFSGADLRRAKFDDTDLRKANLSGATLWGTDFNNSNLSEANFERADLSGSNLINCNIRKSHFRRAFLSGANLTNSDLYNTDFTSVVMIQTNFAGAILTDSQIYGISAWDIKTDKNTKQDGLIITKEGQPAITVDNLEVAQFIYLLLNNIKLREVINTVANKAVLILGRFGERKSILDSIANELRKKDYLPIMFDFDRPLDKTLTETVLTLAGLSKFVIAVMSDPNSVPWEVANIKVFDIPIVPLIQEDQKVFPMFDDLKLKPGFIQPIRYKDSEHIKQLMESLLQTAEGKHKELRELKKK
jgi:uncharacterized protein YjbI with pentapeptide repeats